MRAATAPTRNLTRIGIGLTAVLALTACGGGSDDSSAGNESTESGDSEGGGDSGTSSGELVELSGTIEALIGDAVTSYTISVPEGFTLQESSVGTTPRFEITDLEFGERDTRIELLFLPEPDTAQGLIDSWVAVNSTITVFDQADEEGLSWFTYMTPSSSNPDEIAFGTATTSRTLVNGTSLQCRAATQAGIDEEWGEADARATADANLAICRTLMGG